MRRARGFTLLELLVVVSIIALLMAFVGPRYWGNVVRTKEAVLREDLHVIREQLDRFYVDRGRYPSSLNELVERRYLRSIPIDPLTERADSWLIVPPPHHEQGGVANVQSGAPGLADDGTSYRDW